MTLAASPAGSTVCVLDTRRDMTSSGFAKFKTSIEGAGFGARVAAPGGARGGGRHVSYARSIRGERSSLGLTEVEDPNHMHIPGRDGSGVLLRFMMAGEGMHYVYDGMPAFSPQAGQLLACDAAAEHAIDVRQRSWRIAFQVPAAALRVSDEKIQEIVGQQMRWQGWQSSFVANFCKGIVWTRTTSPIPSHNLDQLLVGVAEFLIRSSFETDRGSSASALRRARARDYIFVHLSDLALSPAAVAADQGVSMRQLARCFAEEGTTIAAEIKRMRLESARGLLSAGESDTKVSITEVARLHGFASLSHFSRSFTDEYGLTPTEFLNS